MDQLSEVLRKIGLHTTYDSEAVAARKQAALPLIREALVETGIVLSDEAIGRDWLELERWANGRAKCRSCEGYDHPAVRDCGGWVEMPEDYYGSVAFRYGRCAKYYAYKNRTERERLLQSSRLPKLLRQKTFANFREVPGTERALKLAKAAAESDAWLTLSGTTGCGKSHLAAAIMNARLDQGREAVFATVPELLWDFRRVMKSDKDTTELIEIVKTAELLVLDDLGVEKATDWALEQLFVIINGRLLDARQTIVTTNYNGEELIAHLGGVSGQRIVSRLRELGEWCHMKGAADYRLRRGKE